MDCLVFPVTKREATKAGIIYSSKNNKAALFPTRLRKLRERKKISQDVLAKELSVSKSTIGLWETGDTLPDAKSLRDLATYYAVSADYLLGLSDVQSADFTRKTVCEYAGLSDKALDLILTFKDCRDCDGPRTVKRMSWLFVRLLEYPDFFHFLRLISRYIDSYSKVCNHFSDQTPYGLSHEFDQLDIWDKDILCIRKTEITDCLYALIDNISSDAKNNRNDSDVHWID